MRIDLEPSAASGSITISNDEETPLSFQVSAVAWSQDEGGRDVYTETGDLVFFPRIMTVVKGASQVIRVGVKTPAGPQEKTFRLFVRGMAAPAENSDPARVAVEIRMGIPVFLQPARSTFIGNVDVLEIADGSFRVLVRNSGTAHFRIEKLFLSGLDGSGREIYAKELDGWYLLSGASRRYEAPVPGEICRQLSQLLVRVKTDQTEFNGTAAVETGRCRP